MLAEFLDDGRCGPLEPALAAAGALLGEKHHGAVDADGEHFFHGRQIGVGPVVQDEWAVAAETGGDGRARLRVDADFARQRQQLERLFQVYRVDVDAAWHGGALGPLLLRSFAELHVGAEAADAERHREACVGIMAKQLAVGIVGLGRAVGRLRELTGEAAVGIA